jgi:hypothetical protein
LVFVIAQSCSSANENRVCPFSSDGYHRLPLLGRYELRNSATNREGWWLMSPEYMIPESGFSGWQWSGSTIPKFVSIQERDSTIYLWNWGGNSDTNPLSDSIYLIIDIVAREERYYFERDNFIKDIELYHNSLYPQWHSVLESWQYLRGNGVLPWKVLDERKEKEGDLPQE